MLVVNAWFVEHEMTLGTLSDGDGQLLVRADSGDILDNEGNGCGLNRYSAGAGCLGAPRPRLYAPWRLDSRAAQAAQVASTQVPAPGGWMGAAATSGSGGDVLHLREKA